MKKLFALFILLIITGCSVSQKQEAATTSITEITYWQYWTGFEGNAIEKLIDKFNSTHSNIKVKMLTISEPRKKTLLSIIGGTPPDVISSIAAWVPELSRKGGIVPLDEFCIKNKISEKIFIPAFWKMLYLDGHIWALPTTPTATALYWNKNLFKEAGLDPERPPKTLKELEEFSDKITKRDSAGKITRIGFLPSWPPWAFSFYGIIFGGNWGEDSGKIVTANNSKNIQGWQWAQDFSRKLGAQNVQTFQEQFGNYQGPNNPFYSEKIAIEVNGVWEGNFIPRFAPNLKWGVAPAPTIDGRLTTIVDSDCILIPKGSKHPKEAFEFIKWLIQPENLEELCILQGKFSPLIYSDREDFFQKHSHPYIKTFVELSRSKDAVFFPQGTFYEMYRRELKRAFESVIKLKKSPDIALNEVQNKIKKELTRQMRYENLRALTQ